MVLHQDPHIKQSDYQRSLDEGTPVAQSLNTETVRYWSDFNRVFYHPRSIVQINDYELGSTLMPFEQWESGEELFASLERNVDLLDRDVRVWAEECDQMQGIQVFTGGDDAWGAFAAKYAEEVRDEFGKMGLWVWGIEEEYGKGQKVDPVVSNLLNATRADCNKKNSQSLRTVNAAKMIYEMSTHASMYTPLSVPPRQLPQYSRFDGDSQWHTSALLSAAIESITLPTRLKHDIRKWGFADDLEAALNVKGNQRIAQLRYRILGFEDAPLAVHGSADDRVPSGSNPILAEKDTLKFANPRLDMDLSCFNTRSATQYDVSDQIFGTLEVTRMKVETSRDEEIHKDAMTYLRRQGRTAGLPLIERLVILTVMFTRLNPRRYHSSLEYPLLDSFPPIFLPPPGKTHIAVHTSLSTTSGISKRIKALQRTISQTANFDERESLYHGLGEISEAYEVVSYNGSDESDE